MSKKQLITIIATIFCIILAFIIVLTAIIIPNRKYKDAIALMNAGNYAEAISAFELLNDYKDSAENIKECKYRYAITLIEASKVIDAYETLHALEDYKDSAKIATSIYSYYKLKDAKAGDYVFFGSYEQDNNIANGKEDIEWLVLDKKDSKILLISKCALDCQTYSIYETGYTWENSTLRDWLNNEFINNAFSSLEQSMIPVVTVPADQNPKYNTDPGNTTHDKLFILSIDEASKYFDSNEARKCDATDYAIAKGAYSWGSCMWSLRTPGSRQFMISDVFIAGNIRMDGSLTYLESVAVRPALWIDLSS